ncbi:SRPBCC domain-containing protein [Patescibacteria group bacterium]
MKTIEKSFEIKSKIAEVFKALTDPFIIMSWSKVPCIMDANVGSKFSLFGGYITGENLEMINNKKIVQEWSIRNWEKSSKVTFELEEEGDNTIVTLNHENIPDDKLEEMESAWNQYFFDKIQEFFKNPIF